MKRVLYFVVHPCVILDRPRMMIVNLNFASVYGVYLNITQHHTMVKLDPTTREEGQQTVCGLLTLFSPDGVYAYTRAPPSKSNKVKTQRDQRSVCTVVRGRPT